MSDGGLPGIAADLGIENEINVLIVYNYRFLTSFYKILRR